MVAKYKFVFTHGIKRLDSAMFCIRQTTVITVGRNGVDIITFSILSEDDK